MSPHDPNKHIMLVDDDQAGNLLTRVLLEEEIDTPMTLLAFGSAQEALAYLTTSPAVAPALLLVDINMPGTDGFAFLDQCLAQNLLSPHTRGVVFITSSIDPASRLRAEAYSCVLGIEEKPITAEEMTGFLARYLPPD